jgi:opacity protein-like surface antigen
MIKSSEVKKLILITALLFIICMPQLSAAQEDFTTIFNTAKSHLTFSLGYGESYPGLGETKTRVQDVDVILKYGHFLSEEIGASWYRGRHEILVEVPFYYVASPKSAIMTGINFLACWDFTSFSKRVVPYLFVGGGAVYTNLNLPNDLGSKWNGNYQGGVGTHYFLTKNIALDLTARYHHISNAGTAKPNVPLNSTKVLIGLSRFW